jgi:flavin reductase (DIM6/NTAB) family NADH-FMN oxidoreductase RutF
VRDRAGGLIVCRFHVLYHDILYKTNAQGQNYGVQDVNSSTRIFSLTLVSLAIMMNSTMENPKATILGSEQLRAAMRGWSAGVTVVTAIYEDSMHGMTVNSFTSISLDPAMITISLQASTRTHELVSKSRAFGLTILSEEQAKISDLFAGRTPDVQDRFAGLQTESLVTGSPLIVGGLAWMDCRVAQTFDVGLNTLFIAEVLAARGGGQGKPLIYHNRQYWGLSQLK